LLLSLPLLYLLSFPFPLPLPFLLTFLLPFLYPRRFPCAESAFPLEWGRSACVAFGKQPIAAHPDRPNAAACAHRFRRSIMVGIIDTAKEPYERHHRDTLNRRA
jgi:hypothetical protein